MNYRSPSEGLILVSIYHFICGLGNLAIMCLIGFFGLIAAAAATGQNGSDASGSILIAFFALLGAGIFFVLALANLIAGWGLLQRRGWAHITAMVLAVFRLPNIPFGTAAGILIIWYLLTPEAQAQFA